MKAVLLSIQPKWCEKIAIGTKTVEVRKTKPKIEPPFKCYIYCTISGTTARERDRNIFTDLSGKVIGEFICDNILYWQYSWSSDVTHICKMSEMSCVPEIELLKYADDKTIYGLHISDFVLYDKPKEISEFKKHNRTCYYDHLGYATPKCKECKMCNLKRPPQSWCYVVKESD